MEEQGIKGAGKSMLGDEAVEDGGRRTEGRGEAAGGRREWLHVWGRKGSREARRWWVGR